MLKQLLNTPQHPDRQFYQLLPVSTSLEQQLKKQATQLLQSVKMISQQKKTHKNFHDFVPNEDTENIKSDLVMLKLKGYMDKRNISGKNQQLKKLPSKIQVGKMIQGDPFLAAKTKIRQKKQMTLTDYYLELDKKQQFSTRKFSQIQRTKQRRKKITKKSLKKLNKRGKNK